MTLSTSVEKKTLRDPRALRAVLCYLAVTAFCILFDKIYGLFGHGVRSVSISLMFLYPLIGGVVPFLILWLLAPWMKDRGVFRLSINLYNSGIALLATQSMMNGVFEIAGTSSPYITVFIICGWGFILAGVAVFLHSRKESA